MKYFIANWKARMNLEDTRQWLNIFLTQWSPTSPRLRGTSNETMIIICPPFPYLSYVKEQIKQYPFIKIGSQDISQFDAGSYTGEVNATMMKGIVDYSIIGHSERRNLIHETDEVIGMKIHQAKTNNIEPILCVRNEQDKIPQEVSFVAYEPVEAIGTGKNEAVEEVIVMKKKLSLPLNNIFIYGGSVNEQNASIYLNSNEISGFLVGSASLDPVSFLKIINSTK